MIWGALLSGAVDLAKDFIQGKVEESKIKRDIKLEKMANDADWEKTAVSGMAGSWKDEWFTIVLSAPLLFIGYGIWVDDPSVIERVKYGFQTLQELPEFYQYLLYTVVGASFGLKLGSKVTDFIKK